MQIIRNSVEIAQTIANQKGHQLGEFALYIYGQEVWLLGARCLNEINGCNCMWSAVIDPFRSSIVDHKKNVEFICPNMPLFALCDCQAFNKTQSEKELIREQTKKAEEILTEKLPGFTVSWSVPEECRRFTDLDLMKQYCDNEAEFFENYQKKIFPVSYLIPEYVKKDQTFFNMRLNRKTSIEKELIKSFPLVYMTN